MQKQGFHKVSWNVYYLPHLVEGVGIFDNQNQGFALCAKWIIRTLEGDEARKILI